MSYVYCAAFAAVVVFFVWLGCQWEPEGETSRAAERTGPSPRHPAARALNPPPVELTSREEVIWEAFERQYGTPLERLVPQQRNSNEGDS